LQAFRYFTRNLVSQGLCRQVDIQNCFGVSAAFVARSYKTFKEEGEAGFFKPENRHGYSHKIVGKKAERIQALLDKGQSVNSIARKENLSEGAIRYAIQKGYLKKKDSGYRG
jgi:transposase